ncbi:hypothetical protein QBC45DRAFT_452178 [Copromyces sp. CBS 386.78]|nr:hypothetical protein QBC45DRAFT_452178 [Copromyces sp. CBS 386.78]
MNPPTPPFRYPEEQVHLQKQTYSQVTKPDTKNDEEIHHIDEELSLDPAEATLVRAMKAGKSRILHCLKLRGPKSLEADKLFMKLSPNDFRLKREQDTEKLNKFKFYKHNLHAPKGSNNVFVCIPSHPWPEFSQPLTCLHCNLTTDNVTIDQFQLPSIDTSRPRTSEVRILHNQNLCRYHDYYLHSGRSLGYHELWALNAFHQVGISFGTDRESNPGRCRRQGLKKYLVGKRSYFRYFIHRMREEVLVERGHLVTTEADLKLGTFFEEESVSEYVPDAYKRKRKAKRIGVIGDGRPVVGRRETKKEDDEEEDDDMEEVGPPGQGAPLTE